MRHAEKLRRRNAPRPALPTLEGLEGRQLLAGIASTSVFVTQAYSQFMDDLKRMELNSKATPAEYLALRDDARAISAATASTSLNGSNAQAEATAVSTILDRSTVDGGLGSAGWADVEARLQTALTNLGVGQALIDQTFADMKAVGTSARVTPSEYVAFNRDFTSLSTAETIPGNISYLDTNPSLYFAQHLGGFFRGWAVQREGDLATLKADLHATSAGATPSQAAIVQRDAHLLETLVAKVPSQNNAAFLETYKTLVEQSGASGQGIAGLDAPFVTDLGINPTRSEAADLKRLIADAPAFYHAVASSPANVQTITQDVQAVVNDGVSAAPNPFKITIQ